MEKKHLFIVFFAAAILWVLAGVAGPEIHELTRIRAEGIMKGLILLAVTLISTNVYIKGTEELREEERPVLPFVQPHVHLQVQTAPSLPTQPQILETQQPSRQAQQTQPVVSWGIESSSMPFASENALTADSTEFAMFADDAPTIHHPVEAGFERVETGPFAPPQTGTNFEPAAQFPNDASSSLVIPAFDDDDFADEQTSDIVWGNSGLEFDSEIDLFDEEEAEFFADLFDDRVLAS